MHSYSLPVEHQMRRFYRSLNERDRRRYGAVEAMKLGHGGLEYVANVLRCDSKTISKGIEELESEEELDTDRQRKKGVGARR